MKKILSLGILLALSSTVVFADFATNLKNAAKKDVQNAINAKTQANQSAAQAKKQEKIKELNAKLAELNKEKDSVKADKNITEVQRTLKLDRINKQIDFYTKQKAALK